MNILAICGAANKERNTATMLKNAFDGAMSVSGAIGEITYLYDLNFKGCIGCHSCKLLNEKNFAHCAMRDDLTPILEKAIDADVLLIGSPIYFSDITGETRSFIERYLFPGITYNKDRKPTYPKRTKIGWIFTMNAPGEFYRDFFGGLVGMSCRIIGDSEYVMAFQTQQFEDYSKYAASMFDAEMVKKRHIEQFPKDCKEAFEMGKRLAEYTQMKFCQSCGMSFDAAHIGFIAKEKDGSESDYCIECYRDGEFLQPDATITGMVDLAVPHFAPKLGEQAARVKLESFITGLARWKQEGI